MDTQRGQDEGAENLQTPASPADDDAGEDGAAYEGEAEDGDLRGSTDSRGRADEGVDADGRTRDALGRVVPSRLNWLKFIRAVPSLIAGDDPAFAKEVPGNFFTLDQDDNGQVAVVACPCGEEPRVPLARSVECDCERFYLFLGSRVLVAGTPAQRPTPVVD